MPTPASLREAPLPSVALTRAAGGAGAPAATIFIVAQDRPPPAGTLAAASTIMTNRRELAWKSYLSFAAGDRAFFEEHLSPDFRFSSPPDPLLDRAGWFERCWPGAGRHQSFEPVRLLEVGDEVIVTYVQRSPGRPPGQNTEILTFEGDLIVRTEVYFGWNLP